MHIELLQTLHALTGKAPSSQRYLLAVSGGLDSVVMAHLFVQQGLDVALVHCNFMLRGAESDADEAFVQELAQGWGLPCFSERIDAYDYARRFQGSVQMAAREIRYRQFEQWRKEHGFDWIVTAHHANDALETFFINFLRRTGLRGLAGIPANKGHILRPLLSYSRETLEAYYQVHGLLHREDASNAATGYLRNKIRHRLTPVLQRLDPGILNRTTENLHALSGALEVYDWAVEQIRQVVVHQKGQSELIDWRKLEAFPASETVFFELLRPSGFSAPQAAQAWSMRHGQPGRVVECPLSVVLLTQDGFLVKARQGKHFGIQIVEAGECETVFEGGVLALDWMEQAPDSAHVYAKSKQVEFVREESLIFPLTLRPWQAGDVFCPIGMQGKHKKVQDLLTDLRYDRLMKQGVYVLENGDGAIIWVLGVRLDERFKLDTMGGATCWRLEFKPTLLG